MNIRSIPLPQTTWLAVLAIAANAAAQAPDLTVESASPHTAAAHKAFTSTRDVVGKQEFDDATRGLVGPLAHPGIRDADGNIGRDPFAATHLDEMRIAVPCRWCGNTPPMRLTTARAHAAHHHTPDHKGDS
jgi:hypothetical protein